MPSSDSRVTEVREISKSKMTSRRTFLKGAAATGAVAAMYVAPKFSSVHSSPAYASITGLTPCLEYIDFDTIGGLSAGDRIGTHPVWNHLAAVVTGTQPWSGSGVTVETLKRDQTAFHPYGAMIFDSDNPTGGDTDLKTPNAAGHITNVTAQHNILIVSEEGDATDPDDDAGGGTIVLQFSTPRVLDSIELIDIDDGNTILQTRLYAYSGQADLTTPGFSFPGVGLIGSSVNVPDVGNNSWQTVPFSRSGVRELRIRFKSSGAISRINFVCP